jgi:hypothetical protein
MIAKDVMTAAAARANLTARVLAVLACLRNDPAKHHDTLG